jgi:hypothetical protein
MASCAPTGAIGDLGIHQTDQPFNHPSTAIRSKGPSGHLAFQGDPV